MGEVQLCSVILLELLQSELYGGAGYGGSYFSPPWLWILAINLDHAGMREPGNSLARDEAAWARLYNQTMLIVNHKLNEIGLPSIESV